MTVRYWGYWLLITFGVFDSLNDDDSLITLFVILLLHQNDFTYTQLHINLYHPWCSIEIVMREPAYSQVGEIRVSVG